MKTLNLAGIIIFTVIPWLLYGQEEIIFDGNFSEPSLWRYNYDKGDVRFENGVAILNAKTQVAFDATIATSLTENDNYLIETTVNRPEGFYGVCGITFSKKDDENFCSLLVLSNQVYALGCKKDGHDFELGHGTLNLSDEMKLKVEKINEEVNVYANNKKLASFPFNSFFGNSIGIVGRGENIRYSSFLAKRLEKETATIVDNKYNIDFELITQDDHKSVIYAIAYSPDGKLMATGGIDKVIYIRNVNSGVIFKKFAGHTNTVYFLKFTPDSRRLVSSGSDGFVKIWDIEKNKVLVSLKISIHETNCLDVSSDGKFIAIGGTDHSLTILNAGNGNLVKNIDIPETIYQIRFTPDSKYLVAGTRYGKGYIWNIADWSIKVQSDGNYLYRFAMTPDGKTLYSNEGNKDYPYSFNINRVDISNGSFSLVKTETGYGRVDNLEITSDGKYLFIGSEKDINIIEIPQFYRRQKIEIRCSQIDMIALSPDGKLFSFDSWDGLQTWNVASLKPVSAKQNVFGNYGAATLSPNGKTLLLGNTVWDFSSLTLKKILPYGGNFVYSPDGKMLVESKELYNPVTFDTISTFGDTDGKFIRFSADGKLLAKGIDAFTTPKIEIWKTTSTKKPVVTIEGQNYLRSLCFSPDGKFILGGIGNDIFIWNSKSGKEIIVKTGHRGQVRDLEFSPDGKTLASAGGANDNFIKFWDLDVENNHEIFSLGGHLDQVSDISFSPDGTLLASASEDRTVKIWDIANREEMKTLSYHTDIVEQVLFSPDGKFLISTSEDGSTVIYNLQNEEYIRMYIAGKDWLIITPDGFFDGSPGCGKFVVMSKGFGGYGPDLFALKFNRPDVILSRMELGTDDLISHYYNMYKKRLKRAGLTEEQISGVLHLPQAEILDTKQDGKLLSVNFRISDDLFNLKNYNLFINDVPLYGAYGKACPGKKMQEISEKTELAVGNNKIEISCTNEKGVESYRAITYAESKEIAGKNLYLVAFGVSKYKNPDYSLQYAHKDALDLEKVLQSLKGKGFENVYTKVLVNEQVTPDAIKASKDFVKNAKVDDTFILFIAGHGMHDTDPEATYYFLTSNADLKNLKGTAADFETIEDLLQGIPPRNKLFLMDACESGEIDDETYENLSGFKNLTGLGIASRGFKTVAGEKGQVISGKRTYLYQKDRYIYNDLVRRSGAIVFSSSKGGELSYERSDIENGLFTEYIMKALTTSEADKDNNGIVSTDELRNYVSTEVAKASGDLQHPTVDRDNIYQKFGFKLR